MTDTALLKAVSENDLSTLRQLAFTPGGYGSNEIRKKVWPLLVAADTNVRPLDSNDPALRWHRDKTQVTLDVDRCVRRLPTNTLLIRRRRYQQQLMNIILQLLTRHPDIHYYQGLHDIVLTFVLTVGDTLAYAIMDVLVEYHLRDFLDVNMTRTRMYIAFLRPLLALLDPPLEEFITRSQCYYFFSLSWVITWFGHVIQDSALVTRLVDVFLASHPLMPIYVSAMLVIHRREELLSLECEMSTVHAFLSNIPEDVDYERLLKQAWDTFQQYPPNVIAKAGQLNISSSTTLTNYGGLLQKVDKTRSPMGYWLWAGVTALTAAAGATLYHYTTITS